MPQLGISVLLPYQKRHLQLKVQTIQIIFTNNFQQLHLLIMHFQHLAIKAKPNSGTTILEEEIVSISVQQRTDNPMPLQSLACTKFDYMNWVGKLVFLMDSNLQHLNVKQSIISTRPRRPCDFFHQICLMTIHSSSGTCATLIELSNNLK